MTDVPPALNLIVTNPNLSGRALKAMTLVRLDDGSFDVCSDYPSAAITDGQTTIINVPLGGKIVISEATDASLPLVMSAHPAVTGKPAPPLSDKEETRRVTLAGQVKRTKDEDSELAALQARVPAGKK